MIREAIARNLFDDEVKRGSKGKPLKITIRIGNQRIQVVRINPKLYEVAVVTSTIPSQFADTLQEALEIMNSMITVIVWERDL